MSDKATIDFESFSAAGYVWDATRNKWKSATKRGLSLVGAAVYAEHPSTKILTCSYHLPGDADVSRWQPGQPNPQRLFDHIAAGGLIEAQNVMFERLLWEHVAKRLHGWPELPPAQLRCSMATARVNNYPGALAKLGEVLQLDIQKDKDGTRLLNKFSMPRNPTKGDERLWIETKDDPADAENLYRYCDVDVRAEMAASAKMTPMSAAELEFWLEDQKINWRGLAIDRQGVRDCIAVLEQVLAAHGDEFRAITGGINPTELQQVRGWLETQNVLTDNLDAAAIESLLGRDNLPAQARRVLEIRQLSGSASVKKLYAMNHTASRDDRIRNLIVHHGARTGRPTGDGAQPLNMPKAGPKLLVCGCGQPYHPKHALCPFCGAAPPYGAKAKWTPEMAEPVLHIMATQSAALVEYYYDDPVLAIMGCVRSLFVGGDGLELVASDYTAIEAVVLAMLAGEQWRIDTFNRQEDIYLAGAAKIKNRPGGAQYYLDYSDVNDGEHHPDRQKIGKVSELACLAADTLVLTDTGYRRVVEVDSMDLLWDGVGWVQHEGVVFKGARNVINLDGVNVTSDHRIFVKDGWTKSAAEVKKQPLEALQFAERLVAGCGKELLSFPVSPPSCYAPQYVYDIVNAGPRNRFTIKTNSGHLIVHNCGFGGWIGAYMAFGYDGLESEAKAQILAWRAASPAIIELWGGQWRGKPWSGRPARYGYEGAVVDAIQNPGTVRDVRGVKFEVRPAIDQLIITLLSGRELVYHSPRLTESTRRYCAPGEMQISYMTWNSNPNYGAFGWVSMSTFGGRLTENIVQATAHDLLRYAILRLRDAGFPTVLHVYDEIVVEVPEGGDDSQIAEVERIMAIMPPWAEGWPIRAAGGWRGKRYRKG